MVIVCAAGWANSEHRLGLERQTSDALSLWIEALSPVPLTRRKAPPPVPALRDERKWGRLSGYLPRFLLDEEVS